MATSFKTGMSVYCSNPKALELPDGETYIVLYVSGSSVALVPMERPEHTVYGRSCQFKPVESDIINLEQVIMNLGPRANEPVTEITLS